MPATSPQMASVFRALPMPVLLHNAGLKWAVDNNDRVLAAGASVDDCISWMAYSSYLIGVARAQRALGAAYPFLDERGHEENTILLLATGTEVRRSAVADGLIVDDDLAEATEAMPALTRMIGILRDDLYKMHRASGEQLKPQLVANCFCYAFAKGAEAAYAWNASPKGQVDFS